MHEKPTFTWSLRGLSERESTLLASLMGLASGRTRANWDRRREGEVDMLFCGPDEESGVDAAARHRALTRAIPVSVLRVGQKPPADGFALPAPVRIGSFFALLEDVEERVLTRLDAPGAEAATVAPAVPAVSAIAAPDYRRDPAHALLVAIGRRIASATPGTGRVAIGGEWIDVDVEQRLYRASAPVGERLLAPLASQVDMPEFQPTAVRLEEAECESLERLLWLCGLLDRSGSLLPGLDESRSYRLGQWPDFGVAVEAPRFVKLCALLVAQAMGVAEMARAAPAPVEDVRRFLNICQSLGILVAVDARPISALLPRTSQARVTAPAPAAGVLDRIRGALRIVWR